MPLPLTIPALGEELSESFTEYLSLPGEVDCAEYGWVKIGSEWIQYAGVDRSMAGVGINNLVRGLPQGAAAYLHWADTPIYFGVAMPKNELYRVLIDQAIVYLNELFLGNASSKEKQTHQELIGFYEGRVKEFWRNWSDTKVVKTQVDISAWINM